MGDIFDNLPIKNIYDVRILSGGDVNEAYKIYSDEGIYFCLIQKNARKNFFQGEIEGLKLFEENNIRAPRYISDGKVGDDSYLLLEYLEEAFDGDQRKLAKLVAKMHRVENPNGQFGFDYSYEGSKISFSNSYRDTWKEIFLNERMDKLANLLSQNGLWGDTRLENYKKVRDIIDKSLDDHKSRPSLLHGDLWAGNFMFLENGEPAIFDPSPLFGDREFDIGISMVFSGFDKNFYQEYNKIYPLEDGYILRLEFYKLYLLMIHLHKFGKTYMSSVDMEIEKIINKSKIN